MKQHSQQPQNPSKQPYRPSSPNLPDLPLPQQVATFIPLSTEGPMPPPELFFGGGVLPPPPPLFMPIPPPLSAPVPPPPTTMTTALPANLLPTEPLDNPLLNAVGAAELSALLANLSAILPPTLPEK